MHINLHYPLYRVALFLDVLIALGGLLWCILVVLMAWAMLRPPRMSAGKAIYHLRRLSPGDLGFAFEELSFSVRDIRTNQKLNMASWWIPAAVSSNRCAILLHGYADAKVGAIAWAPVLRDLGFNILAIDLRAHGDSDGYFCTGGFFEREDIDQIINQLLVLFPAETQKLVLFGASLGAAVACGVAARRDDVSALILDSPFADYRRAIKAHIRLSGLPGGALLNTAIVLAQKISHANFAAVRPADLLATVKCPVFSILGLNDDLLDRSDLDLLQQATLKNNPKSHVWLAEDTGHLQAMATQPKRYQQEIESFLESANVL